MEWNHKTRGFLGLPSLSFTHVMECIIYYPLFAAISNLLWISSVAQAEEQALLIPAPRTMSGTYLVLNE